MGLWGPTRLYLNKICKKMYVKGNVGAQDLYDLCLYGILAMRVNLP
jgi:hypothetical protein